MNTGRPWWVPATRVLKILLYLNAAIWLGFGVATAWRMTYAGSMGLLGVTVVGVLMLGNAAAFALAGWGIGRGRKLMEYFALALLAVNILLTFTDQVGLLDWLTLILDVVILGLLAAVMAARSRPATS
jgi:hypothetical protein